MTQNNDARDIIGTVAHMKKRGTLKILIIALAIGIALLLIGTFAIPDSSDEDPGGEPDGAQGVDLFEYKDMLEKEIEGVCRAVSGVKSASVVVFFSEVGGSIYAQNVQSGGTGGEKVEYVIIGSGSNAHALYLGESLPTLSGIGVVCDTGNSEGRRGEICALLSAAYGLPMTRIYVSEAQ